MVKNLVGIATMALPALVMLATASSAQGESVHNLTQAGREKDEGSAALRHAAEAGKYLFIFFHNRMDQQTEVMRDVFDATMEKIADKADFVVVNTTNRSEKAIVDKFDAKRAPMPMVLAIASNGAVTGGYPLRFDEEMLLGAFVSTSTAQCMKALQDGKMVFLCAQNESTKFGREALKAVRKVKADARYAKSVEIVLVDPTDETEAEAMKRLKVDTETDEAIILLMAPPGTILERIQGATTDQALVKAVQKALAGKGKECCPGGKCGPKKAAGGKAGKAKRKS